MKSAICALLVLVLCAVPSESRKKRKPTKKDPEDPFEEWADSGKVTHVFGSKEMKEMRKKKASSGVLVMFYAPWCGHCKKMKPGFAKASVRAADLGLVGFGAIDCTRRVNKNVCSQSDVGSFPTLKFFAGARGVGADYDGGRDENGILKFAHEAAGQDVPSWLTDEIAAAEAAAKEKARVAAEADAAWTGDDNKVVHLGGSDFKQFLSKTQTMLTMFYAPWCGHCKAMKPAYMEAASEIEDSSTFRFTAVDCTEEANKGLCKEFNVTGYPTLKNFASAAAPATAYKGARNTGGFVAHAKAATL